MERPSKKEGFCFKIFNPLDQSIWASRGPEGETMGAVCQPLPTSYLIFRSPSQADGKCWMDALELALRCSSLLKRSMSSQPQTGSGRAAAGDDKLLLLTPGALSLHGSSSNGHESSDTDACFAGGDRVGLPPPLLSSTQAAEVIAKLDPEQLEALMKENEMAKRFLEAESHTEEEEYDGEDEFAEDTDDDDRLLVEDTHSDSDSDSANPQDSRSSADASDHPPPESDHYVVREVEEGEFGPQVRPGMDLSKVVLPTFILEPRSFLDKLSDYYYHADMLAQVVKEDDPFLRMKYMARYYLSGFYKKPKGLKKPYNPILGETFRCAWHHPNGSRTFYVAEQVSHHPPVSAIYVTNRVDGFAVCTTVLAKSKFYGNSTSAVLEGCARLTLLPRREEYVITMPYAHCKGILMGTLSMELGGKVTINCETTGYSTELEFKLKPFLGGNDSVNIVSGKIRIGKDTVATIDGHWDGPMHFVDKRSQVKELLWSPTPEIIDKRLKRMTVPMEKQGPWESEKLWQFVTASIRNGDQVAATEEKTKLEDLQRKMAKERKEKGDDWKPKYFERGLNDGEWVYKYADMRPWDTNNDLFQYENDFIVMTHSKHRAPLVKMASMSMQQLDGGEGAVGKATRRQNQKQRLEAAARNKGRSEISQTEVAAEKTKRGLEKSPISDFTPRRSLKVTDLVQPGDKTLVQEIGRLSVQVLRLEEKVDELREQHHTTFWRHAVLFLVFAVFQAIVMKWFLRKVNSDRSS
ncbi:unnamed protein product [Notodromas monacha]|uniref:Oxysterol-binding protein n=1 Tax=Notodromas monacha TaxID=399045 RepID=A0A7R9GFT6_9CRUS|nr:unnamed protein product [Notodromas monacha]CAG0919492.1 unnamed protein product [Notodromas monacha]